ncbi:hypothetical protein JCM10449v2_003996 [Rhodotorula kratochvilovae]
MATHDPPGPAVAAAPFSSANTAQRELLAPATILSDRNTQGIALVPLRSPSAHAYRVPSSASDGKDDGVEGGGVQVDVEDADLAKLSPEQRKILEDQLRTIDRPAASVVDLFRFATRTELLAIAVGAVASIAAGIAQPLYTVIFGNLTKAFTDYGTATLNARTGEPAALEALRAAKSNVLSRVNEQALLLVYIGIATFFAVYISTLAFIVTGERITRRIRERYLHAVLRQNIAFFDKLSPGEVTSRIENDTHLIQEGISDKFALLLLYAATFFGGFVVALVRCWRLALVLSTIIPCSALGGVLVQHFSSSSKKQQLEASSKTAAVAEEAFSSIRTAHAFGLSDSLARMFRKPNEEARRQVVYAAYALAFYYSVTLLLQGRANTAQVTTAFFAVLIGAFSLGQMAPSGQALAAATGAATQILACIERVPCIDSASDEGLKPSHVEGLLELEGIDFIYPSRPGAQVLYDFNSVFPLGKMTALVGGSGDPVAGTVKLDGVPLKELNVKWLRNQIGLVMQEPVLFSASVAINIEHGLIGSRFEHESPEKRRYRVVEAAKLANADGFIQTLPQGYDTQIGESGILLSGGQKQRIAIARAVISDPKILLLDEATSGLDSASERAVQAALDKASSGRTTIAIAHRLSTIRDAHQIIAMSSGRIVESATTMSQGSAHELLLRRDDGAYAALVRAQRLRERLEAETKTAESAGERDPVQAPAQLKQVNKQSGPASAGEKVDAPACAKEDEPVKKRYGTMTVFRRLLALNAKHWKRYILALLASYPVFALVFGIFSETDRSELRSGGNRYALYCFVISYFDRTENSTGRLTSSVTSWTEKINAFMSGPLGFVLNGIFMIIIGVAIGLCYSWKITLVGAACFPFTMSAGVMMVWLLYAKEEKVKESHSASAQMACEAAGAIRTVAALTREKDCCRLYNEELAGPVMHALKTAIHSNVYYSLSQATALWVTALMFWYGIRLTTNGEISVRDFYVANTAIVLGALQAGALISFLANAGAVRSAAKEIFTLVDSRPAIDAESGVGSKLDKSRVTGHLRFEDVHFRYPSRPDVPVLQGLDLVVKPGQLVGICGESGCGKSSALALLQRFYDPLGGRVLLDGRDIRELEAGSYRSVLAVVAQEAPLYSGDVRYNVALGAAVPPEQVTQEEVEQACKAANIHDLIVSLPDGYDTDVGGKGTMLSGGQKQRIAIARALIRNPKILLLDEATSALDSSSERAVQDALDKVASTRTTIAIAHRLSTIQHADVIYVFDHGRIAERGTHQELLAQEGIYANLVKQQALEGPP